MKDSRGSTKTKPCHVGIHLTDLSGSTKTKPCHVGIHMKDLRGSTKTKPCHVGIHMKDLKWFIVNYTLSCWCPRERFEVVQQKLTPVMFAAMY